jgi:hypothetical protein
MGPVTRSQWNDSDKSDGLAKSKFFSIQFFCMHDRLYTRVQRFYQLGYCITASGSESHQLLAA